MNYYQLGPIGDPDLFVSNKHNGMVAVSKDNYIWKSTNVGADRVDIHPNDLERGRSNILMIGVLGYKDRNEFELEILLSDALAINPVSVGETLNVYVKPNKYTYFSLDVDSSIHSKIFVAVSPTTSPMSRYRDGHIIDAVNQDYGRGVYTIDTLSEVISNIDNQFEHDNFAKSSSSFVGDTCKFVVENARLGTGFGSSSVRSPLKPMNSPDAELCQNKSVMKFENVYEDAILKLLPNSEARDVGIFPVVYLSANCMYPTASDYGWRASGIDGSVGVLIESDEWKYSQGKCFFSIYGFVAGLASSNPEDTGRRLPCELTIWLRREEDMLDDKMGRRYLAFQDIFNAIDGGNISQRERARLTHEDQSLTYGEVEYVSFVQILVAAEAKEDQIFYDLGCGAGKAIVTAAMSGINFKKCVGVELLEGLCECSRDAVRTAERICSPLTDSSSLLSARLALSLPPIEIIKCDLLQFDWSDSDIVYFSSICFPENLISAVFEKGKSLRTGSKIITLKLPLCEPGHDLLYRPSNMVKKGDEGADILRNVDENDVDNYFYEVVKEDYFKMTWGRILVYILRRTSRTC